MARLDRRTGASDRRGRPRLTEANRRTQRLSMRMTAAEMDHAYTLSFRTKLPLATLVRIGLARVARRPPGRDVDG